MDYEVIRANERLKGWGSFCDNAALAFFIGSVTKYLDPTSTDSLSGFLMVVGVVLGIAFLVGAWHIRGLLQPEG